MLASASSTTLRSAIAPPKAASRIRHLMSSVNAKCNLGAAAAAAAQRNTQIGAGIARTHGRGLSALHHFQNRAAPLGDAPPIFQPPN
jgi:hypothetical protein